MRKRRGKEEEIIERIREIKERTKEEDRGERGEFNLTISCSSYHKPFLTKKSFTKRNERKLS